MKSLWVAALDVLLVAAAALAGSGGCVRLETERNYMVESKDGVQAIVRAAALCGRGVEGKDISFVVRALDADGQIVGSATGRFTGTISSAGGGEAQIFVHCDPEKVQRLEVKELE